MSAPKSKSIQLQPYPLQIQFVNGVKLPKLQKRRKRNIHTKNPYTVKQYLIPDDSAIKPKKLNGFLLLAITKNDMPHEIFRANLSRLKIIECAPEDMKYFINLELLDLSENQIQLEQLTAFPVLKYLKLCANNIQQINLNPEQNFMQLKSIDLSFNYLQVDAIKQLAQIKDLNELYLSNNELIELPEEMNGFTNLQKFDISDNNFSSNFNGHILWYSLAQLSNLEYLNISKNFLRVKTLNLLLFQYIGIHTERLQAGNFSKLSIFDISYNQVENQHNLICARNFRNLKEIIVTGNPFAILKEFQGIEMEIHARTGGKLINEEVPKPYLKKKKDTNRPSIKFQQLRRIDDTIQYKFEDEKYIDLKISKLYIYKRIKQQNDEQIQDEEQNNDEVQNAGEQVLYLTEHHTNVLNNGHFNKKVTQGKQLQEEQAIEQQQQKQQQSDYTDIFQKNQVTKGSKYTYEEFKKLAHDVLSDGSQDLISAQPIDIKTAYRNLRQMMNKPDAIDYKNFDEPHYLKPTASIQRYKYSQQNIDDSNVMEISNKGSQQILIQKDETHNYLPKIQNKQEEIINLDLYTIYKQ